MRVAINGWLIALAVVICILIIWYVCGTTLLAVLAGAAVGGAVCFSNRAQGVSTGGAEKKEVTLLTTEYARWEKTEKIRKILHKDLCAKRNTAKNPKVRCQHEWSSALERYLVTVAQGRDETGESERKFKEELTDHFGDRGRVAFREVKKLLRDCGDVKRARRAAKPKIVKANSGSQIVYRDFRAPVTDRVQWMINTAGLEATTIALLRYSATNAYSSSWGIPRRVAEYLYSDKRESNFGLEGFASSLNARIIGERPDAPRFGTLFPDVDAPFGGVASFFDVEPGKNVESHLWVVNPPFVEPILDRAADRVVELAEINPEFFAVFFGPRWEDSAYYQKLKDNAVAHRDTKRGQFRYEDDEGNPTTGAPTSIFAIGSGVSSQRAKEILDEIVRRGRRVSFADR
jgi:hypothetical protein